jgi:fatty-acyl-CoA synthase
LAIVCANERRSYAELDAAADAVARAIGAAGLSKGDRIAVLSQNSLDSAAMYFGSAGAGTVLIHLSRRSAEDEIRQILGQSGARLLFHDGVSLETDIPKVRFGEEFAAFAADSRSAIDIDLSPDDPFCITYTGGTTGRPRGVLVSHRARAGQARAIAKAFGITGEDVVCVSTPMAHVAGLFVCFQPAIAVGATCVLLERWDAGLFLDNAEAHGVTATVMVPTQLIDLLAHEAFRPERLAALRRVVHAGASMPPPVLARLMGTLPWVEFIENYGQSELGALTVRRGVDLPAKAGSIGRAIKGVGLAVLGADGMPVAVGEVGELCCRGSNALLGYDGEPDATEALYKYGGSWVATGDAAHRDKDGFYFLVERLRDMIIRGGENIYPVEIENVLFGHPDVAECAVIGISHPRLGEVPVAYVVRKAGAAAGEATLIDHCAAHLARHKKPAVIHFIDELPKTAVGKIRKNVLRARND